MEGWPRFHLAHDRKLAPSSRAQGPAPELAAALGNDRFLREIEIAAQLTHLSSRRCADRHPPADGTGLALSRSFHALFRPIG